MVTSSNKRSMLGPRGQAVASVMNGRLLRGEDEQARQRRGGVPCAREPMSSTAPAGPTGDDASPNCERRDRARGPCELDDRPTASAGGSAGAHERHPAKGPLGPWLCRWLLA